MADGPRLRIGELSRRVGVSPELLRAWETRYELLRPERTSGGLRLFSHDDERRVRAMQRHLADGLAAAEAARLAKLDDLGSGDDSAELAELDASMQRGVETFDELMLQAALDRLFTDFDLTSALPQLILPFLHRLGERWASGETGVRNEHFASSVIGGRLRALAQGWGGGAGPLALLACPAGEQHDLGLLCFGLALRLNGWRVAYLGSNIPLAEIAAAVDEVDPAVVILCAVAPQPFSDAGSEITALRARVRVAIGGAGASEQMARRLDVESLGGDVMGEAAGLASNVN